MAQPVVVSLVCSTLVFIHFVVDVIRDIRFTTVRKRKCCMFTLTIKLEGKKQF